MVTRLRGADGWLDMFRLRCRPVAGSRPLRR
jgi:hypothetical protein